LHKIEDAIRIVIIYLLQLTKALEYFPDYYDCLAYRGKMFLKIENYEHAIDDFKKAMQINQNKGFAYLGKGTA
jgi:tetratricopeptide (TPR) repeat protein